MLILCGRGRDRVSGPPHSCCIHYCVCYCKPLSRGRFIDYRMMLELATHQWDPPVCSHCSLSLTGRKTYCFDGRFSGSRNSPNCSPENEKQRNQSTETKLSYLIRNTWSITLPLPPVGHSTDIFTRKVSNSWFDWLHKILFWPLKWSLSFKCSEVWKTMNLNFKKV